MDVSRQVRSVPGAFGIASDVRETLSSSADALAAHHTRVREHYRRLASAYRHRANAACDLRYRALVETLVRDRRRVLEVGGGSSDLLEATAPAGSVNCDLTPDTLRLRHAGRTVAVAGAGERLPFRAASFDAAYAVNVLEHVGDVEAVVGECARVLRQGGVFLAITPHGDWEFWLDLAERLRLKIPEGPHSFLSRERLRRVVEARFEVLEHRLLLAVPTRPVQFGALVDRALHAARLPWGFFQCVIGQRRDPGP